MTTAPIEDVDYDAVVAEYERALLENLRRFGVHKDFLELWVPDDDPLKGIVNLFEAAREAGRKRVRVIIGMETAAGLDGAALRAALDLLGKTTVEASDKGLVVRVDGLGEDREQHVPLEDASGRTAALRRAEVKAAVEKRAGQGLELALNPRQVEAIGARYQAATAAMAAAADHQRTLPEDAAALVIAAEEDGLTLQLAVDTEGKVVAAAFSGAGSQAVAGVMEAVCRHAEGLPVQEVADHGVLHAELALRSPTEASPVAGISHPFASDAAFSLPIAVTRAVADTWRTRTGQTSLVNEYGLNPTQAWLDMGEEDRRSAILEAIAEAEPELPVAADSITVQAIEWDVRVVLGLPEGTSGINKSRLLLQLERVIRSKVDLRLEVYQAELKDKNTIRRLS